MRAGTFRLLVGVAALVTVLSLHRHILQLLEIPRTYATFHPLIKAHPELLYRYPEARDGPDVVPKIMHYVKLGDADMTKWKDAMDSCRSLHPDWDLHVWGDDNATAFLAEDYPDILPHYEGYYQNIQRANVLRYALLHKYGGVYLDLDVSCRVNLEETSLLKLGFVSPGAHPAGVNNAFIAASPGHPFLTSVLDAVPSHDMFWGIFVRIPYVENMLSTGCMFYSNRWMDYVRSLLAGRQAGVEGAPVYVLADESGDPYPHMLRGKVTTPIFAHGGASSWHSWDAALLLTIGANYTLFVSVLGMLVVSISGLILYRCLAARRRASKYQNDGSPHHEIKDC